jgi:hypothetical protein
MMKLTDQRASSKGERRSTQKGQARDRVRRVSVTDPIAAARRYDYADAFELRLEGPDRCSPEEWVRANRPRPRECGRPPDAPIRPIRGVSGSPGTFVE